MLKLTRTQKYFCQGISCSSKANNKKDMENMRRTYLNEIHIPGAGAGAGGRRGCSLAGAPQPQTTVVRAGISQSSEKIWHRSISQAFSKVKKVPKKFSLGPFTFIEYLVPTST